MHFSEIMELEPHGPDVWVGLGPRYPWGGLYGGQIIAQGLAAASVSVDSAFRVHSLHAFFIRQGDHDQPVRYEVDRIRDGRSFATRRVVARQSTGAILNMSTSFTTEEEGDGSVQTMQMPEVEPPESLSGETWSPIFDRRYIKRPESFGRSTAWFHMSDAIGDDPRRHNAALAYLSDDLPTEAIIMAHPQRPDSLNQDDWPFWSASLDHAIWFHRPLSADQWHLHDFTCHALMGSRGLSVGNIFAQDGIHLATVTQEVLIRERREGS